ncbi:MAG TPA: peptidoglycan DD-metalloendopeptidase family protein [Polyangiaceae bacterium]|nr:peptidoglycan DD-metalloendopeptidase family protein [Polyangiaceae bacterium]
MPRTVWNQGFISGTSRLALSLWLTLEACSRSPVETRPNPSATASERVPPAEHSVRRALALGFTGFATLAFDASRLAGDHTLVVRFMPIYEGAYRGVLVSDESGGYRVGMAPYSSLGQPALEVSLGGVTSTSPLPAPILSNHDFRYGAPPQPSPRWLSLVVSVRASQAQVFLNGEPLGTLALSERAFSGQLYLGRLAHPLGVQDQFYGYIDDVVLFDRALDAPEVRALAHTERIDAKLAGLVGLADFDEHEHDERDERELAGVTLARSLRGAAEVVALGSERDPRADSARFPRPSGVPSLTLPFARGQVWMLIQGMNSARSHHDSAAFALDFQRMDPTLATPAEHQAGAAARRSAGQPFFAAAAGKVVSRVDCFGDDNRGLCPGMKRRPEGDPEHANRNLICVEHAPSVVTCYLHSQARSARVQVGDSVPAGALLGLVGQTGAREAHLHFALSDRAEPNEPGAFDELTTLPFEFQDYEASSDFGRTFEYVRSGTPSPGQWLRRSDR